MLKFLRGACTPLSLAGLLLILLVAIFALAAWPEPVAALDGAVESEVLPVCNATVKATSRSPATGTSYDVTFVTTTEIAFLSDVITMELHEDIRVPRAIAPPMVRVQYSCEVDQDCMEEDQNGNEESRANGIAADVSLSEQDDPRHPTILAISPAIRRGEDAVDIPAQAKVTVTFQKGAGITNPTEGGAFSWKVGVNGEDNLVDACHPEEDVMKAFVAASGGDEDADVGLLVDREIQLSHEEIGRGQEITVIGRGFKNGHTLAVWRDANVDGQRDSSESELCRIEVAGNDIGYCSFTVHSPPFAAAFGKCPKEGAMDDLDCNFINAVDGLGGSTIILGKGTSDLLKADQALELVGRVLADTVQGPGGNIQVEIIDFPEGDITSVTIGGVPAEIDSLRVGPSGRLFFSIAVPDDVRLGRQYLRVELERDDTECAEADCIYFSEVIVDISQPKALLRVFPETVLPNQRISISGLGFTGSRDTVIDQVKIGGHVLKPARINNGEGSAEVDRNGNWSGHVNLPLVEATTTPGTRTLEVRDSRGRTGSAEVTIPPRELKVTPIWGRPGSIVTVTGTGFPSRNDYGSSVSVRIIYDFGSGTAFTSAEPDANGAFTQELRLPLNTPTPSSNRVRAEFDDDNGITVITSAPHEVPGAVVQVSPASGPPGSTFTLSGFGFRKHVPALSVMFGSIDVTPGGSAITDSRGEFRVEVTAPGLDTGLQTVEVTVAGVTASTPFEVTAPGVVPGVIVPAAEGLEELGDGLEVAFHFNNDTKAWTYYDPLVSEENTLNFLVTGETYLVLVRETTEAILNGRSRNLTCLDGRCWNHIVW
ncbi:MAG: IPT/TIG domain-containing protein [Chloroflexi bacterium]|nr:IPT/TIG domain-containing protein [Chloroflexota bacterium]